MRFQTFGLSVLANIYRFIGGRTAPEDFDIGASIQPVHDVSREAELNSIITDPGAMGFFQVGNDNVHAVGGETVIGTIDPYAGLDATWGTVGQRWIWLFKYSGTASSTAIMGAGSSAALTVAIGALGNALARRDFLIFATGGNSTTNGSDLSATFPASLYSATTSGQLASLQGGALMPFPLPPGSNLIWRTIATAATPGTIRLQALCWIGPFGVMPPGLR